MADDGASVVRPDDLLTLGFEFYNLHSSPPGSPLTKLHDGPSCIVVVLPGQHLSEQRGQSSDSVNSVLAGPSRLAFLVPDNVLPLPYTLVALLDWSSWTPLVPANALPANPDLTASQPNGARPTDRETAIELPFRLLLSPDSSGRWAHSPIAVTPIDESPLDDPTRQAIVNGSGNFSLAGQPHAAPPLIATHLTLSALGAWTDLHGSWTVADFPSGFSPQPSSWRQVVSQGRDHYVHTLVPGTLFPLGLRACYGTIIERKLSVLDGTPTYSLQTHSVLVLLETARDYDSLPGNQSNMPLRRIELKIRSLDIGSDACTGPTAPTFVRVAGSGNYYQFHVVGRDWANSPVDLHMPLMFAPDGSHPSDVAGAYGKQTVPLRGQRVALGPLGPGSGGTALLVESMTFCGAAVDGIYLPFAPQVHARVPAVQRLLGSTNPDPATLNLADLTSTDHDIFATIGDAGYALNIPATVAGGLAAPNLAIKALSQTQGLLPGLPGQLQSVDDLFHDALAAKLLGGISLKAVLDGTNLDALHPTITQTSDGLMTTLEWRPPLANPSPHAAAHCYCSTLSGPPP
jgi:hypothetical protein